MHHFEAVVRHWNEGRSHHVLQSLDERAERDPMAALELGKSGNFLQGIGDLDADLDSLSPRTRSLERLPVRGHWQFLQLREQSQAFALPARRSEAFPVPVLHRFKRLQEPARTGEARCRALQEIETIAWEQIASGEIEGIAFVSGSGGCQGRCQCR